MRIFVAGATGVIGVRLVPLLVDAGHTVAGMTRSPEKVDALAAAGAEPVVCDVYDEVRLRAAVRAFSPDALIHQLTDLPDDASQISKFGDRNDRIRLEGTSNLLAVGAGAGVTRLLAQSVAWKLPGERAEAIRAFEAQVLGGGGVVIRYGQFYGPGTFYPDAPPPPPRVHVDEAARATIPLLDAPPGTVEIVDAA